MRPDFLRIMAASSAARVAEGRAREPWSTLRRRAAETPAPPRLALDASRFDVVAEVKRRAPSSGPLERAGADAAASAAARARAYAAGGAAAISVLTEPDAFSGDLAHLAAVAGAVRVPVLRKDFLVDPYQVFEGRAAGAAGVLLVVRILPGDRLGEMLDACREAGVFALVEAFDAEDLARAGEAAGRPGAEALIGVNARDLATLQVDRSRFEALRGAFPGGVPRVAESGIASTEDAAAAARLGYDAVLAGTALMKAGDPAAVVREMLAAGRAARRGGEGRSCASA